MSKKDFDREYIQIESQYLEMLENLKDMEKELADGLVNPDLLEQMKEIIKPLRTNYEMWNYIKFLLNKPTKKKKEEKYKNQNKKLMVKMKTLEETKEENNKVLDELKEYKQWG